MSKAKLTIAGTEALVKNLRDLTPAVQRQVLRPAARAATTAPRQVLKRSAPRRSGALRKAQSSKVTTSKDKAKVFGTVGANRKYTVMTKKRSGKFVSGTKQVAKHAQDADSVHGIRPSRYAHLAGPGRTADYMAEAQQATESQSLTDFTNRARTEMLKVTAKMAAKAKK